MTATENRPKRRTGRGPATVSASALAVHLACTRQYIAKLTADAIIEKRGDGYDQDQCRLRYLAHLRSEHRHSPRSEAAAEYARQKSRLLELKIAKQENVLMMTSEHEAFVEQLVGLVLTKLGGMPIRVGGTDLAARRKVENIIFEVRTEIADQCQQWADESKEPPD
jgi:hypothetical protein